MVSDVRREKHCTRRRERNKFSSKNTSLRAFYVEMYQDKFWGQNTRLLQSP